MASLNRIFGVISPTALWVVIRNALASIFTGLKLAIGYNLVIVVVAKFSGADASTAILSGSPGKPSPLKPCTREFL